MTAYGAHITRKPAATSLLDQDAAEKKAARKKLLDEIFRRRQEKYRQYYSKMALGQAK